MNKQIETIATIIYDELCECVRIRGFVSCDFCECINEDKDCNIGHHIAKALYNAGYRKVDETAKMKFYKEAYEQGKFDANAEIAVGEKVVMSKEEYERQSKRYRNLEINYEDVFNELQQTRKETAREILQKVIDFMEAWTNDQYLPDEIVENIEALEKNIKIGFKEEFGVEVE